MNINLFALNNIKIHKADARRINIGLSKVHNLRKARDLINQALALSREGKCAKEDKRLVKIPEWIQEEAENGRIVIYLTKGVLKCESESVC